MSFKSIAIAALALGTIAGGASAASAHGHHHFRHGFGIVIGGGDYHGGGCGFYREMWEDTGLFKWKRRYYMCKGWW